MKLGAVKLRPERSWSNLVNLKIIAVKLLRDFNINEISKENCWNEKSWKAKKVRSRLSFRWDQSSTSSESKVRPPAKVPKASDQKSVEVAIVQIPLPLCQKISGPHYSQHIRNRCLIISSKYQCVATLIDMLLSTLILAMHQCSSHTERRKRQITFDITPSILLKIDKKSYNGRALKK